MLVSIIIPTLNEAGVLAETLARLAALRPAPEILVADGGSSDGTPALAAAAGARLVRCARRGRAFQMNEGARAAAGDVLLFLHADLELPQAAWNALFETLAAGELVGGAFRRFFRSRSRLLRWGAQLATLRGHLWGLYFGDQAIFARRAVFERLHGFPEILLFEDLEFSRALRKAGRTVLIREPIFASSRRFEREGPARRLWANFVLTGRYLLGQDSERLARLYYPESFTRRYQKSDQPGPVPKSDG
jgi:rSAM/selenodomain-associated transferase 2